MRTIRILGVALMAMALPALALGGQVRVTVSSNQFTPMSVTLNNGDQVVWVWTGTGLHSVTSGDFSGNPDGIFDSGIIAGGAFTWKSDRTGTVTYYCEPHVLLGMVGQLGIAASGVAVSNFRITEVQYNVAGDLDLIEIANLGGATGNLGRYRLSVQAGSAVTLPLADISVAAGGRVVIHANASGTNTPTDVFVPTLPALGQSGSVSLYTPNTVNTSLGEVKQLVDFVQWGGPAQPNETTADMAGFWNSGEFAPTVADGHSIEFCGTSSQYGAAFWAGIASPNPGGNGNCSTPTLSTTWGRIKALYR